MLNGRGDDQASTYTTQHNRVDDYSVDNRGLPPSLFESSGSSGGWSTSITSYIGSWMGRDAGSPSGKSQAESGLSPGNVREPLSIQGASAYYNGQDSNFPSQSYSTPSADFGIRDLNGKFDKTLAVYEPHQMALYDPQLSVARKEVKALESALAVKDARIEGLEKALNGKKKFIDEMEKDFKEVRKSLFVMEGRVKDLESINAEYQVKIKEKEQEVRGLLQRLEKSQSNSAGKDDNIKELQSALQEARREIQHLQAFRADQEKNRETEILAVEQLKAKVLDLTSSHGLLESKKLQLAKQVRDQMERLQDLDLKVSTQALTAAAKELEVQDLRDQLGEEQEKFSKLSMDVEEKSSQMNELIVYVEQLEQELATLQKQLRSTSTDDHELLKAHCLALEEQIGSHESEMQNLRARLREEWETTSNLNERIRQSDLQIEDLKQQIEVLEGGESDVVKSIPKEILGRVSSLGSQAAPDHLEKAVRRVHEVAGIFSRLLMKAMEQGKIDGMAVARNNFVRSVSLGKAAPLKYVLEAITCKLLFQGFEHECFDLQDSSSGFMDLERQRVENFRQYKMLNAMDYTEQYVHSGDGLFTHFCRNKLEDLSDTIPEISSMVKEIIDLTFENSISAEDTSTEVTTYLTAKLGTTFVQLAVCVWQVHKLAFAFHPMARIFRVAQSEKFVEKYMESVIFQESESDEDEDMPSSDISRVDFMVVPGFLVDRVVVRSRVFVVTKPVLSSVRLPIRTK